ncbi:uncharacterized protein E6C27_scaffold175G001040 [Cucumis melo var. makuwa]|uniref:Uncharacterized protein n=1 Tax=Cucumis melo var. makuwa TaxID=1194695 RepID=A0A5A7U5H0_CUCMM|nr:uncharacterized protein E6C27_scaffold175G001040 [Cucumis melo var. makuwa]
MFYLKSSCKLRQSFLWLRPLRHSSPSFRSRQACLHSNPSQKIKVGRWCNPLGDPISQLPCTLRVYSPVNSHTCQTSWSVFQDGSNGEPIGRCQERADDEARQKARAASHDRDDDVSTGGPSAMGLSPSLAPPSRGLMPDPPLRTLVQTTIRTSTMPDSQAGLFPRVVPPDLGSRRERRPFKGQRSKGREGVREVDVEVEMRHQG